MQPMGKYSGKILVVDDEASLVQLCKFILEQAGFEVWSAYSGRQALTLLQNEMPDIIILDVMMPGMTGIEVCQEIRARCTAKHPFIVMYTADDREATREKCMNAGADKFVVKTLSPFDLPQQIQRDIATE